MRKKSDIRTALIVLLLVLLMMGLIVFAYLFFGGKSQKTEIQLPDPEQTAAETDETEDASDDGFATVTAENVLQVLQTLTPAAQYYQSFEITIAWGSGMASRTAQIWRADGLARLSLQDTKKTENYLTDGTTVYLWYDGDTQAVQRSAPNGCRLEWVGIPDYLSNLQEAEILDASFVPADGTDGDRLYVRCRLSSGAEHQYWIDLETALLVRVDILVDQQLTCQILQQECTIVTGGESTFDGEFTLPDGSSPFAS